ncbi:hypothetical protein LOK49_LG08G00768 [Camellia lanceoleosa]|uniref:Uncharacterized protein n=1 Tax=Camellia lanceoleosa TaxID=1840588 RepID=A0ACC0GQM9_9ERIC|nr:hypothetical protein LOK49_LG08G00768 [Camellia lanceoleosa]
MICLLNSLLSRPLFFPILFRLILNCVPTSNGTIASDDGVDEDEVQKLVQWAIDTARLDPSPPTGSDNNDNDSNDDNDIDIDIDDHQNEEEEEEEEEENMFVCAEMFTEFN